MRSGHVNIYSGKLWYSGRSSLYWYAEPGGEYTVYYLGFDSEDVRPDDNFNRYGGFSLRCLSTVLD